LNLFSNSIILKETEGYLFGGLNEKR